eukprot:6435326-Amphidinium_carterae.2
MKRYFKLKLTVQSRAQAELLALVSAAESAEILGPYNARSEWLRQWRQRGMNVPCDGQTNS